MSATEAAYTLRPLQQGDAGRIALLIGDWEVTRWLSAPPYPYAVADAEAFITANAAAAAATGGHTRAIVVGGEFAGMVGIDKRSLGMNLGYWLGRPYWGRRIMSNAAAQMTADFFATSREDVLNSGYFSGNEASAAIQRRLGFVITGEGLLFNRPAGQRLPHVATELTRDRYNMLRANR